MINVHLTLLEFMDTAPVAGAEVTVTVKIGVFLTEPVNDDSLEEESPDEQQPIEPQELVEAPLSRLTFEQPEDDKFAEYRRSAADGTVQCSFETGWTSPISGALESRNQWIEERNKEFIEEGYRQRFYELSVDIAADVACAGLECTVGLGLAGGWGPLADGSDVDVKETIVLDFAKVIVGHTTPNSTTLWFWLHGKVLPGFSYGCDVFQAAPALGRDIFGTSTKLSGVHLDEEGDYLLVIDRFGPAKKQVLRQTVPVKFELINPAKPDAGHCAASLVDNLEPASTYAFRLRMMSEAETTKRQTRAVIATGAFTTAAVESSNRLSFVFGSCHLPIETQNALGRWEAPLGRWEALSLRKDYDFMLLIGDQIYGDEITTYWPTEDWLTRYVNRYHQLWKYRPMREVVRRTPTYMIMDDHEVKDDWGTVPVKDVDDDHDQNFIAAARERAGLNAYRLFQHLHNPRRLDQDELFYSFRRGPCSFFIMDGRTKRGKDPNSPILGTAQRKAIQDWAESEETQAADVIFFVSPVPIAFLPVEEIQRLLEGLRDKGRTAGRVVGVFGGFWKGLLEFGPVPSPASIGNAFYEGYKGYKEGGRVVDDILEEYGLADLTTRDLADLWTNGTNQRDLGFVLDCLFRLANYSLDGGIRRRAVFILAGDVHSGAMHVIRSTSPNHQANPFIYQLISSPISNRPAPHGIFENVVKYIQEGKSFAWGELGDLKNDPKKAIADKLGSDPSRFRLGPNYVSEFEDLLVDRNFGRIAVERVAASRRVYRFYLSIEGETGHLWRAMELDLDDQPEMIRKDLTNGFGILEFRGSLTATKVHPSGERVGGSGGWSFRNGLGVVDRIDAVGDLNGDGIDEIIITDPYHGSTGVLQHDGEKWKTLLTHSGEYATHSNLIAGLGDFDGDGAIEILTTRWGLGIRILKQKENRLELLVDQHDGTSIGSWNFASTHRMAGIGDLNGDGRAEILITSDEGIGALCLSEDMSKLSCLVNMPDDSWFGGWRYSTANRIAGLGDFDGDGAVEILITSDWGIGILKQREHTFDSLVVQPTGTWFGGWNYDSTNRIVGIGDFDGDGKAEILITSDWGIGVLAVQENTLQSLAVQPSGTRFGGWLYDSSNNRIAGVGDFNGDGRDEFVITSPWGIGLLALMGESFGCPDLRPYGSILGNWLLEGTDQMEGVGNFTHSAARELLIRKRGGLKSAGGIFCR